MGGKHLAFTRPDTMGKIQARAYCTESDFRSGNEGRKDTQGYSYNIQVPRVNVYSALTYRDKVR
jgi:hypothetical protein